MNDLDTLRPEVAQALEVCDRDLPETWHSQTTQWGVIRAELVRLAEYEQAAGRLAVEKAEFRQRAEQYEAELASIPNADEWHALRERAEKAEAELAALKARIAEAQECGVVALCGGGASLSHEPYPSLVGKRVRLVVED